MNCNVEDEIMDVNLKDHLKELEERHIGLAVRKSHEKLDEILADDFFRNR